MQVLVKPARVIFTDSKPEIELGLQSGQFWKNLKFMKVTKSCQLT